MGNNQKEQFKRTNISFESEEVIYRDWYYRPVGVTGNFSAIVMSHGYSTVKEQGLAGFAEAFCDAGFIVLAFDYRFLGESDGNPRGRIVPQKQHDDIRAALVWIFVQEGVDTQRIGLWGTSNLGGHAVYIGALDPRLKLIVVQVLVVENTATVMHEVMAREDSSVFLEYLIEDHTICNEDGSSGEVPIVTPEGELCMLMPSSDTPARHIRHLAGSTIRRRKVLLGVLNISRLHLLS